MRLQNIAVVIILLVAVSALVKAPVLAACNLSRSAGTCNYNGATCTIDLSTTESYDCTTSETSSTQDSVWVVGAANITIASGATLNVGKVDASGTGAIALSTSTSTIATRYNPLWVTDADADGWSSNYNTTFTATASGRRRRSLMRGSTADCNDAAYSTSNTCYSYSQGYYYGYSQGYYYGYGQGYYYGYAQSMYYTYSQPGYLYHIFWPGFNPN